MIGQASKDEKGKYSAGISGDQTKVSLHSIYDIPYSSIGPALHRKNVRVCYAAFHFSEALGSSARANASS